MEPVTVDGDGVPAPRSCTTERAPRTLTAARPSAVLGFNGQIVVRLMLGADDRIISTRIDHVSTDPTTSRALIEAAARSALVATNASTFQTGTFRCEPVINEFNFIVILGSPF